MSMWKKLKLYNLIISKLPFYHIQAVLIKMVRKWKQEGWRGMEEQKRKEQERAVWAAKWWRVGGSVSLVSAGFAYGFNAFVCAVQCMLQLIELRVQFVYVDKWHSNISLYVLMGMSDNDSQRS